MAVHTVYSYKREELAEVAKVYLSYLKIAYNAYDLVSNLVCNFVGNLVSNLVCNFICDFSCNFAYNFTCEIANNVRNKNRRTYYKYKKIGIV